MIQLASLTVMDYPMGTQGILNKRGTDFYRVPYKRGTDFRGAAEL